MRYSFGMRWAQMGLFETYRIAGGEAGMRHFLAQFGPLPQMALDEISTRVDLDDALVEKIGAQSDAQAPVAPSRTRTHPAKNLVGIMHALKAGDGGKGWVRQAAREFREAAWEKAAVRRRA